MTRADVIAVAHALRRGDLFVGDPEAERAMLALVELAATLDRDVVPLVGLARDALERDDGVFLADVLEHLVAPELG